MGQQPPYLATAEARRIRSRTVARGAAFRATPAEVAFWPKFASSLSPPPHGGAPWPRKRSPPATPGRSPNTGLSARNSKRRTFPTTWSSNCATRVPSLTRTSKFTAPAAAAPQADALNKRLGEVRHRGGALAFRLEIFGDPRRASRSQPLCRPSRTRRSSRRRAWTPSSFRAVSFRSCRRRAGDAKKIAKELNRKKAVWKAFVAPRPVPAMPRGQPPEAATFEPAQGYLLLPAERHRRGGGLGASPGQRARASRSATSKATGTAAHEDLPAGIQLIGGTVINDLGWRNHGTAVLGEMVSIPNAKGTVGISHEAKAVVHSAVINGVFNTAGAITNATSQSESRATSSSSSCRPPGPNGKYVAMQYWGDIFSAIEAATAKGITVVEAAGNGDENFELAIFNGTGLQKDSGAIVVGAGVPPTNHVDFDGFGAALPATLRSACRARVSGFPTMVRSSTSRAGAGTSPRSATATRRGRLGEHAGTRCGSPAPRALRRSSPAPSPVFRAARRRRTARR